MAMSSRTKLSIAAVGIGIVAAGAVYWVTQRSGSGSTPSSRSDDGMSSVRRLSAGGPGMTAMRADDPTGALRLEGQVVDADEKPVGGVRVAIDSNPPRETTSEEDGSFAFDGLVARDYDVVASSAGGTAGPVTTQLTADSEPVILRLRAAGSLTVTVVDAATGEGISGAAVELRASLVIAAKTDGDGVASLSGIGQQWYVLNVSASGYAPNASMFDLAGDPSVAQRRTVEMLRGAPVSGRVVDESGKGVAGARVIADPASEPFPVVDPRRDGVTTDGEGNWRLPAVGAGTYRFVATHAKYAPGTSAPAPLDGTNERSGVEIVMQTGVTLSGTVKTSDGEPAAGASVRVAEAGGGLAWHMLREVTTGADGTFSIDGLPPRRIDLVAAHDAGSSAITELDLDGKTTESVELVLDITGTIAGVVVDSEGEPIAEAQVMAEAVRSGQIGQNWEWRVRGTPMIVSGAGGEFRFAGLPPGDYELRAIRPGASTSSLWQAPSTVVATGTLDVELLLPEPGRLMGKVAFADGTSPRAYTVAVGAGYPIPFGEKDGAFSLDAPGGKQTLFVSGPDFMRSSLTVEVNERENTDVGTITVEKGRAISGRVVDPNGNPVEGATVAAGQLISGSGSEFHIPSESINAQTTTTDAAGRFLMSGFGESPLVAQANHDEVGRSDAIPIIRSSRSVDIELVLISSGSLEGVITRDGKPLPNTVVIANPRAATRSNFFTVSGPDGSYALDKLSAGDYFIMAMIGGGGPRPKDMHLHSVDIVAGQTTEQDIDIVAGPVTLAIDTLSDTGERIQIVSVFALNGTIDAPNSEALRAMASEIDSAIMYMRNTWSGATIKIEGVHPGPHTVCSIPIVVGEGGMQEAMSKSDTAPMKCEHLDVQATPTEQPITVTVPNEWLQPH